MPGPFRLILMGYPDIMLCQESAFSRAVGRRTRVIAGGWSEAILPAAISSVVRNLSP